jgi:hypothetical protein
VQNYGGYTVTGEGNKPATLRFLCLPISEKSCPKPTGGFSVCLLKRALEMSEAMKLIVEGYVRLSDREALESLAAQHRRLLAHLETRSSGVFDIRFSIEQIEREIAVIAAGPAKLNSAAAPEIEAVANEGL